MRGVLILIAALMLASCGSDCECGSLDRLVWRWQWGRYQLARECRPCIEDFEVK